jgi:hypothetical protein
MPGMAKPEADRTVIGVLTKHPGRRRRSGPSNLAPGIAEVRWEFRSILILPFNTRLSAEGCGFFKGVEARRRTQQRVGEY